MSKLLRWLKLIIKMFVHVFFRTKLFEYSFYSGTVNIRDSINVLFSLVKGEPLLEGHYIDKYEKAFAEYIGIKHAYSFATGRMGLYVILKALEFKAGDEIILPAYTCAVVPNAIIYAGAKPVWVDIEADTFNIDVSKIEEKITSRTKALYAQHTFGLMCDINKIKELAKKHGLYVIEDCCIALGAEIDGKKAGTFGDVAYFSTDHSKIMSTSSGGMVVTNNDIIAEKIKAYYLNTPFPGRITCLRILFTLIAESVLREPIIYFWGKYVLLLMCRMRLVFFFTDYLKMEKPDKHPFPAKLSSLQAKVGLSQLNKLDRIIENHRKIAGVYDNEFNIYKDYLKPGVRRHMFLRYVFLVKEPQYWVEKVEKYIEIDRWFDSITVCRYSNFEEIYYNIGSCPVAEEVSKHVINLPTHLKIRHPERILKILKNKLDSKSLKSYLYK